MNWSTVLQVATILSLLTPLALALMRAVGKRKERPLSEAQVVQGMTMTLAGGLQERIIALQTDITILQREAGALEDTIDLYREIMRANGIAVPKTPRENTDREERP